MDLVLGLTVKVAFFLLKWSWDFLRLIALFLIVLVGACCVGTIVEVVKAPEPVRYFPDPYVCGQISGYILRFSKKYVPYWAEYEGKSSWEPGFTKNKKGCGANLTELTLIASWPDMKPDVSAYFAANFGYDYEGLSISIKPSSRVVKDMQGLMDFRLRHLSLGQRRAIEYVESMDLYHVRGFGPLGQERVSDFYWNKKNGQVMYMISCRWLPIQQRSDSCEIEFFYPGLGAFVAIDFQVEKIAGWQDVVRASVAFLNEGLIGSE